MSTFPSSLKSATVHGGDDTGDAACELSATGEETGGRTGGNRVQNNANSVRDGAVKTARSGVTATTAGARNARESQRAETHAKGKAATGFEPVNDGFANRSLRPLGYAADEIDPTRARSQQLWQLSLSKPGGAVATPSGATGPPPGLAARATQQPVAAASHPGL